MNSQAVVGPYNYVYLIFHCLFILQEKEKKSKASKVFICFLFFLIEFFVLHICQVANIIILFLLQK